MNTAVKLHRLAHRLYCSGATRPLGKLVYWANKALTSSDIDPRASIACGVRVPHATGVVIGETAEVGEGTTIMPGVVIGARDWDVHKRHATIGRDVILGAGAKVLGPVTIGDAASVGANAVVLEDVPSGATVVGIPARVVGRVQSGLHGRTLER